MNAYKIFTFLLLLTCGFVVVGCAETQFLANFIKQGSDALSPAQVGKYKIGRPYQIKGVWYRPQVNYSYDETGVASWYGPKFHGRPTANGEIFDMNKVGAAHKTLPIPTLVRVTNLRNGKAMNIRINDRGPYAHGRIIDLSKRAAQLLGFEKAGTAPVRVQVLERESRLMAAIAQGQTSDEADLSPRPRSAPSVAVTSQSLPAPTGTRVASAPSRNYQVNPAGKAKVRSLRQLVKPSQTVEHVTNVKVPQNTRYFVQAGAFTNHANANRANTLLSSVGPSQITMITGSDAQFFRVRLGPFVNVQKADTTLARVIGSGYSEARIVID